MGRVKIMTHIRVPFILVGLSVLIASSGYSGGQKIDTSAGIKQQELSLNRTNDRQHVSARVGQPMVVTLQTIGGGHYDTRKYLPTQSASRRE